MDVTIIGTGNMARGIGSRLVSGGHAVTLLGTERSNAEALAADLGGSVSAGTVGDPIADDVVVLAVWYPVTLDVAQQAGSQLDAKVVVDISTRSTPRPSSRSSPTPARVPRSSPPPSRARGSSRPSTRRSPGRCRRARSRDTSSTCSSLRTTQTRSAPSPRWSRAPACAQSMQARCAAPGSSRRWGTSTWRFRRDSAPAMEVRSRSSADDRVARHDPTP